MKGLAMLAAAAEMQSVVETCRVMDVGRDLQSLAWALVLAQNRRSAIHCSPALKEGILALERSGTVVAERDMAHCDLALSCKMCVKLCIVQATMVGGGSYDPFHSFFRSVVS